MDTKMKELIAIGASVTANCVPCLKFHFAKAQEAGASEDEVREAVRVGRMVRKGAAGKWDEEAKSVLGQQTNSESEMLEHPVGTFEL